MAEEQILILRMVEEGKITADQAVELLAAVNKQAQQQASVPAPANRQQERDVQRLVREQERQARKAARQQAQAKERTRTRKETVKTRGRQGPQQTIMASLRALGVPVGGREFAFERELTGEFEGDAIAVRVQNTNGKVRIIPSADDHWHLRLKTRVRASNEADAESLAAKLVSVAAEADILTVEAQRMFGQNASSDIELELPQRSLADMHVSTTNGTINVEGLQGDDVTLKTVNGRVIAQELDLGRLVVSSVNGSLHVAGFAEDLQCKAANGKIMVELLRNANSILDLQTVNGTVAVELPVDESIGYQVNAATTTGSIKLGLEGLQIREQQKRPGRNTLVAESVDFAEKEVRQVVQARTVSGAVSINLERGRSRVG